MTATTYTVLDANDTVVATSGKKATAVAAADAGRASTRKTHRVVTNKGTEVYVVAGVRGMKITPRYSRVVPVPEGVVVPDGMRVAYDRQRHNALILHDANAERDEQYRILNRTTGALEDDAFATTRDAGQFVLTYDA